MSLGLFFDNLMLDYFLFFLLDIEWNECTLSTSIRIRMKEKTSFIFVCFGPTRSLAIVNN